MIKPTDHLMIDGYIFNKTIPKNYGIKCLR
jgi:hypothetical protein